MIINNIINRKLLIDVNYLPKHISLEDCEKFFKTIDENLTFDEKRKLWLNFIISKNLDKTLN